MENQEEQPEKSSSYVLYDIALSLIVAKQTASVSFLQARLNIGFTQAKELMDELERNGIVGPADGIHKRMILINEDGMRRDI